MGLFNDDDGIDEASCLSIYDGSYDFYRAVLETFSQEIGKDISEIERSFDERDEETYRILIHGLKGSGGSAGATHLVEMATQSNELLKKGKWDEAAAYHGPILEELRRLRTLIPERLK